MSAFIFDAIRTPRGQAKEGGALNSVKPVDLVGGLLKALPERAGANPETIEEVFLGCVTQTGEQGGNIAKTALLRAGWPEAIPAMAVNRYCASALDACVTAANAVEAGQAELALGGGVESMSRVAILSDQGPYYADREIAVQTKFVPMGEAADYIATLEGVSREEADAYAIQSQQRAARARDDGRFKSIIPVQTPEGKTVEHDQAIRGSLTVEKLATLPPIFQELGEKWADAYFLEAYPQFDAVNHIHHVGNSPGMVDGASLVLIGSEAAGKVGGLTPRARIVASASAAADSLTALTGGTHAAQKVMERAGLTMDDIDLVEVNEAFAAPTLCFIRDIGASPEQVNVNGGAIALGHPMGATGGMLIGMLIDELERQNLKRGLVAISGAAGVGTAMVIERV